MFSITSIILVILWVIFILYSASVLFWLLEVGVLARGQTVSSDEVVYGHEDVQVRILTIGAEDVVQATVDSIPEGVSDIRVIAERISRSRELRYTSFPPSLSVTRLIRAVRLSGRVKTFRVHRSSYYILMRTLSSSSLLASRMQISFRSPKCRFLPDRGSHTSPRRFESDTNTSNEHSVGSSIRCMHGVVVRHSEIIRGRNHVGRQDDHRRYKFRLACG